MAAIELNSSTLINDANLTNYWRFESNVTATKGSANGTVTGSPTTNTAAEFGNGLSVPGTTGNYVDFGTSTGVPNQFTISFWIKFNDFTTGATSNQVLPLARRDASAANGTWQIGINNGSSANAWTIEYVFYDGSSFKNKRSNTTGALSTGVWYFIVGSIDVANASNSAIYFNNTSLGLGNDQTSAIFSDAGTQTMRAGWSDNATAGCNCMLDDVAIWSRKLAANEVNYLYTGIPINTPKNLTLLNAG
jgi:hypothetical protein